MSGVLIGLMERPASRAAGKPGDAIRFVASTEGVARDGLVIESTAWDLANFKRNPVILWGHDMIGSRPPIGKATDVFVDNRRLLADIVFDQRDEFARSIESKYRGGFLNAVSVGWDMKRMEPGREGRPPRVVKAELLEISAVPVPSDAGALVAGRSAGLTQQHAEVQAAANLGLSLAAYRALRGAFVEVFMEQWRREQRDQQVLDELADMYARRR